MVVGDVAKGILFWIIKQQSRQLAVNVQLMQEQFSLHTHANGVTTRWAVSVYLAMAKWRKLTADGADECGFLNRRLDACDNIQRMLATATVSAPLYRLAVAWGNQTLKHEIFAASAAIAALLNCVALRILGCRLIRPGSHGTPPGPESSNETLPRIA
jgi:hypothetical protein